MSPGEAGSLNRRLCRLERIRRGCRVCGCRADGSFEDYDVLWDDGGEPPPEDAEPEEFCPACGRQTVFTVTWEDLDDEDLEELPPGGGGER